MSCPFLRIIATGFKFQFVGQGLCPWTPLKPFLKEGFKNPKNFQKDIFIIVF